MEHLVKQDFLLNKQCTRASIPHEVVWQSCAFRSFLCSATGTVSVFVTILTYNGTISVGLSSDPAVMNADELEQISGNFFEAELTEILGPKNSRESVTQ